MKIMVEAIGSMACNAGIKNIHDAGYICVGTDASENCFTKGLCEEFYQVPLASNPESPQFLQKLAKDVGVDLVIPTLDEGMIHWAMAAEKLKEYGIYVAISNPETIRICQDKWETYRCFVDNGIPTPVTSLEQDYQLVKPRWGRGGTGVLVNPGPVDMEGMISQELLTGEEFTVDVLCDIDGEPVYIVPRKRINVKEGKSTGGVVVANEKIESGVRKICSALSFKGPINIQCFVSDSGDVKFTEINPRLGGGTALGMAATENWIPLIVETFVKGKKVLPSRSIQFGLKMGRYYNEIFYM